MGEMARPRSPQAAAPPAQVPLAQVPEDALRYLNPQARASLSKHVKRFSDDLLSEASRLEATASSPQSDPQITSALVDDAALLVRKAYRRRRRSRWLKGASALAVASAMISGWLADPEMLSQLPLLILFIVLAVLSLSLTLFFILVE